MMTAKIANLLSKDADYDLSFIYYHPEYDSLLVKAIRRTRLPFHAKSARPLLASLIHRQNSSLCKLISTESPDLCVISQGYIESGVHGLITAKKLGIPTLSYIPFGYSNKEMRTRFALIRDLFTGLLFRMPDAFITINRAQCTLLERFVRPNSPIFIIPNPVTFSEPDPTPRSDWNPPGKLRIGVVGRVLFQQKNQDICIKVAQQLKKRNFHFHFHIIGDGPDLNRLQQLVSKHSLSQDFTLHGWIDNAVLPVFLKEHVDMLFIPSHYEGVPLILLEAFHLGLPFLVSDQHFVHDYNLPKNMLVDAMDASVIANKLTAFVQEFELDRFHNICETGLDQHSQSNFSAAVYATFREFSTHIRHG